MNGHSEPKSSSGGNLSVLNENTTKASMGRSSVSQNPETLVKETKSLGRLSVSQNSDPAKESKILACRLHFILILFWVFAFSLYFCFLILINFLETVSLNILFVLNLVFIYQVYPLKEKKLILVEKGLRRDKSKLNYTTLFDQ